LAGPEPGDTPVMFGSTVKARPLLSTPPTVTTTLTLPAVAKAGTVTAMAPSAQLFTVAAVPLNFTVLEPWGDPKLAPLMVTDEPVGPEFAEKLLMLGGGTTVKLTPGLVLLPTVTVTLPVMAPLGTVTVIEVSLQLEAVAA
jgi:hypothetical protein